jgi:dTDP-4-dehydrorhamnose 3,5-epimerase-like enzyme
MSIIKLFDFNVMGDDRGQLVALESMKNIPFEIKRVYYVTKLDSKKPRGFHAHKKLQQLVVCLRGSCRFIMNNGSEIADIWLDVFNQGLMIDKLVWHEMHDFSEDCLLLVLASDYYEELDYIRDYEEFKKLVCPLVICEV